MKRFLLINSPIFEDVSEDSEQYLSPLGLGYIATSLDKSNVDVNIIDCVKNRLSIENIIKYLTDNSPVYVGINIFTQNYDLVKKIVENTSITCCWFIGGQVVKNIYKDLLSWRTDNIINIIIGEGEFIVPAIVNGHCLELPFIQKDNKKVYKVDKNSIYYPKDISKLTLNRKYLPDEIIYNHYGQKEGCIVTSRGCIYNCAFCGGAKSINKDVTTRERNEISIIHEIKEIQSFYPDIQSIRILDDLFIRNISGIDKAYRIFSNFQNIVWRGMIHVLSILNGLDKVKVLKDSKCQELFIGIESGSENIRKRINKAGSTDDIIKVASTILSLGIDLKGYFIYGFPGETEEDYKHTYELAQKIRRISDSTPGNFRTSVFQFRPYHGTELYNEIMKNDGIIHGCEESKELNIIKGRKQFNFNFGNYSNTSDEILEKYIINTQGL